MRKLLVLGAGLLQLPVIKKAKEMGLYVIAADDDPEAIGLKYSDETIVGVGISNQEKMLQAVLNKGIEGIIHPCSEIAMNTMGYINDNLRLKGLGSETVRKATNKGQMRKAFDENGAPTPKSFEIYNLMQARRVAKQLKGDIIVKPSRSSGSRGVTALFQENELNKLDIAFKRAMDESRDNSVIIEQFIKGPEFSVECIIYDGHVNVLQVTDKKTTGSPYFVELGHNQPSLFPESDIARIKDAAIKGCLALGLNYCAAHAEIKLSKDGPFIMEIGARLGGDFISTELTRLSTGIDMVAAAINVSLGDKPDLTTNKKACGVCIRYWHPKPGKLVKIEGEEYVHKSYTYQYEIYPKIGEEINEIKSSLDRSGHVIVVAPTASEAISRAEDIINHVKLITT